MFRILLAFGSVFLEIMTFMSHGAILFSSFAVGAILTTIHLTIDSSYFRRVIDRLTGFDLPEAIETLPVSQPKKT